LKDANKSTDGTPKAADQLADYAAENGTSIPKEQADLAKAIDDARKFLDFGKILFNIFN